MTLIASTALGQAFAAIINGICAAVGARVAAAPPLAVVLSQVYWRIARRLSRLDRLVLQWHAGTVPRPRPPRAARPTASNPAAPRPRIPDGHAMLIHLAQRTAQYRVDLEIFLDRPDTRALLRAAPQAGRILRPLCRILAVDLPEYLRPPPRPKPAPRAPACIPAARIPANHLPATPDRPLPANIRAAARAWKKYDR